MIEMVSAPAATIVRYSRLYLDKSFLDTSKHHRQKPYPVADLFLDLL
jgi:hypothetical protein